ncbi:MAG: hypothetical protein NTU44_09425, partial [Bacteroidetes bacterium]|nr:hypothetical protein [Bacteroidota bacterium]
MKKWMVFGLLVVCSVFTLAGKDRKAARGPGHFTYSFVENKGQWENRIRYKTTLPYGNLFVEDNCLTFFFLDEKAVNRLLGYKYLDSIKKQQLGIPDPDIPAHAYRVRFEGADPHPEMTSSDRYPDYKNFYLGNDPSHWASKVYQYREVVYHSLYKGIDLQLAQQEQRLKYNFHIAAGADPGSIQLRYEGAGKVRLRKGKIMIETSVANIEELAPVAWQEAADGSRIPVECGYKLQNNTISFSFPKGYDKSKKMVVDPILVFSSYSGSPVDNWGYTATYDNDGYLYAGGSVRDPGYPVTTGAFMMNYGGGISDIAISKYDTTGSFLIFSTYLGGSGTEVPNSLVVNNNNELYVLGCSGSSNYPTTPQAYSTVFKGGTAYTLTVILHYNYGSDIVISRFSQDGTSLLASTYFGGTGNDGLNSFPPLKHNYADDARGEIKIDENQNVYVVSSTQSVDLPVTQGAYQTTFGGVQDACVFKLDASLTYLLWSSYLGGNTADAGYSICFDKSGKFYVAGGTTSLNFPVTLNAYQTVYQDGGSDGFISCFNESGSSLAYSTYYGSTGYDQVYFIDQDKQGYVYALGQTSASGMTYIFNVSWSTPGGGQFITKFLPNLSARVYSTAFGTGNGGPDISPTAFMVDYCNHIYLSGWGSPGLNYFGGTSGLPVTGNAFQTTTDNNDYYFMVMNGDASGLIYATFFGDSDPAAAEHVDGGTSRFDKKGRIYQSVCAGCGGHDGFPTTTGAWSSINGSTNCNNAVIKFDFKIPLSVADFIHPLSG